MSLSFQILDFQQTAQCL